MLINKISHKNWIAEFNSGDLNPKLLVESTIDNGAEFIWHPLGFIMCRLCEEGGKKIRLHIWPEDKGKMQDPCWMIHDHLFDLKSWVLLGNILTIEYKSAGNNGEHRLYSASYQNGSSVLERTSMTLDIEETKRYTVKEGESYKVEAGVLHQSISMGCGIAVTVCETIDKLSRAPLVVGSISGDSCYTYARSKVTKNELSKILEKI